MHSLFDILRFKKLRRPCCVRMDRDHAPLRDWQPVTIKTLSEVYIVPSAASAKQHSPGWRRPRKRSLEPWGKMGGGQALKGRCRKPAPPFQGFFTHFHYPGLAPWAVLLRAFSAPEELAQPLATVKPPALPADTCRRSSKTDVLGWTATGHVTPEPDFRIWFIER